MATKQSTMDYLLDQLSGLANVRARKMFGEYALYCQDKVVALVCNDEVFVKITPEGKKIMGKNYEEGIAYPGAKPSIHVPGDLLEDRKFISELVSQTAAILPMPKPKKKMI
ncbi:MAG: TfoX/Sxy family protein [Candidatus Doudnabacteria bacterium]|nr:TfoX/Sxy family protein [Candidatus Doudnabacteria bacterium]